MCNLLCQWLFYFYLTESANQVSRPGQFSMHIFSADTGSLMGLYSKKYIKKKHWREKSLQSPESSIKFKLSLS